MRIPESAIQAQILQYLGYRGIRAFRINSGMIPIGEGRNQRRIRLAPAGFSDIMAVLPGSGRAMFLEVKAEGNKATEIQEMFLRGMREQGAVAEVVYSVDDVEKVLAGLKENE